ncbi:MAG: methionine--tRNA ligase [Thermodesulfobacteriota bacterium]|nr:methionine--tRNA ligase [Thermodesulfobacteriota bacterium]
MNILYVTTPIYYVNAEPHIGHAYTTIVADVLNRFHRFAGHETYFVTGTDEHGDKVVQAAEAAGESPREYADRISGLFRDILPELSISNDYFIRTTDENHKRVVQLILQKVYEKGDIYFGEYGGYYCFGCERFYTEKELVDGKCPDHKVTPEFIKEKNYFFKMSKYQDWLIEHIETHPDFIRPTRYRNEVLAFLKDPLEDLCISRPKSRLDWGITLPFDTDYVTYVWFDALINYLTAVGYPDSDVYQKFWPSVQHLIAKDILKPHGVYWPTMLKASGIKPYQHLNVHGFWNIDENKMSKSLGNIVRPLSLKDKYGLDAFRYFVLREMVFGLDANFSENALVNRFNSDLANDLGNLVSRSLAMAEKYFKGVVQRPSSSLEIDDRLRDDASRTVCGVVSQMKELALHKALIAIWGFIASINKYIDETSPWALAKKEDQKERLGTVLCHILESLRVIALLLLPFMPNTAEKIWASLGIQEDLSTQRLKDASEWGRIEEGTYISKIKPLFPRVEG